MKNKNPKERLIFSNYGDMYDEDEIREYLFEDHAEDEEWETKEDVPNEMIWDEIRFCEEEDWYIAKDELNEFFKDKILVVDGFFGGWQGREAGGAFWHKSFSEMVSSMMQDCGYIKIWDENGHLFVQGSHHDGTNVYEVKVLTNKGIEYADQNEYEHSAELIQKIFNSNFFSKLPHFSHEVYGCLKEEYEKEIA